MNITTLIPNINSLILEVGKYISEERTTFDTSKVEDKNLHDLVSYVDQTSEKKLINGLTTIFNSINIQVGFHGEETGKVNLESDYQFIIDPLDGTTNFIHQIPHFCISVALTYKNEIIAGWVYEINKQQLFFASQNDGAYCNGKKISVSTQESFSKSLLATGFPVNKFHRLENYMKVTEEMIRNTRGIRRLGTAAYDLCLVASGVVEGYYEYGLSPWDVAAGSIIVKEAGGVVSDFSDENNFLQGEEIVASNGKIHAKMLSILKMMK